MDKLLTIVVPMYNMKDYIVECLNSLVLAQNMEHLEVLVINDGSTDNSYELAHEFELKYPETFRVITKENGHYGSCINRGLQEATGKYIKVLDADDYFITESLACLMEYLESTDVDLIITDTKRIYPDKENVKSFHLNKKEKLNLVQICTNSEIIKLSMHDMTYRRDVFTELNYKQTEGIMYTDDEWIFEPMSKVRTVYYLPVALYGYRLGREGQSVDENIKKRFFLHEILMTISIINAWQRVKDVPSEMQTMFDLKLLRRLKAAYKAGLIKYQEFNDPQFIALDETLKEKAPEIYSKIGDRKLSTPLFPFKYIKIWRKNHDSKFLKIIIELYKKKKGLR